MKDIKKLCIIFSQMRLLEQQLLIFYGVTNAAQRWLKIVNTAIQLWRTNK